MRYEVLGRLQVSDGQRRAFIRPKKVETLLAVLVSRPDQIVPASQLMDEIWGENIPRSASTGVHVYVSQARKFLKWFRESDESIVTMSPGYVFRPGADELDFQIFEHFLQLGQRQVKEQAHEQAIHHFDKALALWRGPVLGGLHFGPGLSGFAVRLTELHIECIEALVDSCLVLGRHHELIGRLYSLIAEYPLREAFYRKLMLALYRSGRQTDALQVYQTARRTLRDELGLEPSRSLQDLRRAIMSAA